MIIITQADLNQPITTRLVKQSRSPSTGKVIATMHEVWLGDKEVGCIGWMRSTHWYAVTGWGASSPLEGHKTKADCVQWFTNCLKLEVSLRGVLKIAETMGEMTSA